jgi:aminoglycoside phosphotransferase (APT) family kinase protein
MVEGIDEGKVTPWLAAHVPALETPVVYSLIAGGHSNLTYRCDDAAGNAYVLRRPPLGHVLESAHDMGREHKIIAALAKTSVPVAPTFGLCSDVAVNGAPFYVMRFIDGLVSNDSTVTRALTLPDRRALGLHVIDVLAMLHRLDPDAVGLGDLGRKEAYLSRQLSRWTKQWEASKTHEVPAMEETRRLLQERMPAQIGSGIVHGDYRLGNMIVKGPRILAVLDWELCTLGDPLADVGYLMNQWVSPEEVEVLGPGDGAPTAVGGFPSRAEMSARYEAATGRDLSGINYYRAFSHWRLAAIGQGVYKRYLVGAMGSHREMNLDGQKQGVQRRAEAALALIAG